MIGNLATKIRIGLGFRMVVSGHECLTSDKHASGFFGKQSRKHFLSSSSILPVCCCVFAAWSFFQGDGRDCLGDRPVPPTPIRSCFAIGASEKEGIPPPRKNRY